ncbi:hypothetical protein ACFOEX_01590, partial [Camelimonas abortus]
PAADGRYVPWMAAGCKRGERPQAKKCAAGRLRVENRGAHPVTAARPPPPAPDGRVGHDCFLPRESPF